MWKNTLYKRDFFAIVGSAATAAAPSGNTTITNPIAANSFPELVTYISQAIITIVLPLAVVGIIWAGFKMVIGSAKGNPGEVQKARKMLGWILLGTAIIVGSSLLARAIINTVANIT